MSEHQLSLEYADILEWTVEAENSGLRIDKFVAKANRE